MLLDDTQVASSAGAFEGTIVGTSFTPSLRFVEKFKSAYGQEPQIGSDTSYDAVILIAQAIQRTQSTDPAVLKDYLNSLATYQGESGFLTFDGKGGVTKEPKFQVVKNGKIVDLE